MRQAGRYLPEYRALRAEARDFLTLCYTPELAAEVTLQPVRRFGLDAAILFSDILVVPDGLGQQVGFAEGEGPRLARLEGPRDAARLDVSRVVPHLAPVLATVRKVRASLDPAAALIGFAGAPWTVATYMIEGGTSRDFVRTKRWMIEDPAGFAALIDLLVAATSDYLAAQVEAGCDALQIFDSWCGVLAEPHFRRWSIAPTKALIEALRTRCPDVPIVGFPRGAGAMIEPYASEAGVDAVALDTTVPLALARRLQARLPVQGNLDPVALLAGGRALEGEARRILAGLRDGPFVFNLGHGVLPTTPPEHVARLVELVRT